MNAPATILFVAVNARYSHCSHAGRTLLANLGDLAADARLLEADLDTHAMQLAADILARAPRLVGFSVYLWNTRLIRDALGILQRVAPERRVILGGPEIVPECADRWRGLADALVCGEGETAFRDWCLRQVDAPPLKHRRAAPEWIAVPDPPAPTSLHLPYDLYTDDDLRHRVAYVETTRGCPHHCLYCTSCGTGLRRFPLPVLRDAFAGLMNRGLRQFRFLDRTFNADEAHACAVLDGFLDHLDAVDTLHLELAPVRLGEALRERLARFPPNILHLEVGVQTLNAATASRIGRREPRGEVLEALQFLTRETQADVHADLIFGLPGEDAASFAAGFDHLVRLGIGEIQVNRLKGLPGTPILRLPELAGAFNPVPPYEVLRTDALSFDALMRLQRFALVWDRLHNRGRFRHALPLLWADPGTSPFAAVDHLARTVHQACGRVHAVGLGDWALALARQLLNGPAEQHAGTLAALRRDAVLPRDVLSQLAAQASR